MHVSIPQAHPKSETNRTKTAKHREPPRDDDLNQDIEYDSTEGHTSSGEDYLYQFGFSEDQMKKLFDTFVVFDVAERLLFPNIAFRIFVICTQL